MLSTLLTTLVKQLRSDLRVVFAKRKRKNNGIKPTTSLPIPVYRPAAPATYEGVEPLSISELEGAQPTRAFEEATIVDGVKSEEERMVTAKHERMKVWVQEEAMEHQRRNATVNEEGAMELNDMIRDYPIVKEIITERNNIIELIEAKTVKMRVMEDEMQQQQRMIQENNRLIELLTLYTRQLEGSVV